MNHDELKALVTQEIAKSKLKGETVNACEINVIEMLKTVTPADEARPTLIAEAVSILWASWSDDC
jgi:hypothetical protein